MICFSKQFFSVRKISHRLAEPRRTCCITRRYILKTSWCYRHWFPKVRYLKNELRDLPRSHSPRFDRWRLTKQQAIQWPAFHEVHGEDSISNYVNQIQSWSQVVMFGKFYGWHSYESLPTETNTNIFCCRRVLLNHFRSVRKGNAKLTSLFFLYDKPFFYKLLNQ